MPASLIVDRIPVIDADTHISEPPDLWTSRVSTKRWGDLVPQVRRGDDGDSHWWFGDTCSYAVAELCIAGFNGYLPDHPKSLQDGDPGCADPVARLERMDEYGIHAQVLYPNVVGFSAQHFMRLKDPELMILCVQAYNDYLAEFASTDPGRYFPIMALPFWDLEASVKEIARARELGHRGVLFGCEFANFGLPPLGDRHWDPIFAATQDAGMAINFHAGSGGASPELENIPEGYGRQAMYAKVSTLFFMGNGRGLADVMTSGLAHRYPKLRFVSVESGVGWIPFLLEALDWQWENSGAHLEHPDREKPSFYFERQLYGCFWFERDTRFLTPVIEAYPNNILFETDYPHPTSMSPGPASSAQIPRDFIQDHLGHLDESILRRVLHDNAASLYELD